MTTQDFLRKSQIFVKLKQTKLLNINKKKKYSDRILSV